MTELTNQQIVENAIATSPVITRDAKKALIWLVRQTEGLTQPVLFASGKHHEHSSSLERQISLGAHNLFSIGNPTNPWDALRARDCKFFLEGFHYKDDGLGAIAHVSYEDAPGWGNRRETIKTVGLDMNAINAIEIPEPVQPEGLDL